MRILKISDGRIPKQILSYMTRIQMKDLIIDPNLKSVAQIFLALIPKVSYMHKNMIFILEL